MSSSAFSTVQSVSVDHVDYSVAPQIDATMPREVYASQFTKVSKEHVRFMGLLMDDMPAALAVCEAERLSGNGFVAHRTIFDLQDMIKTGKVFGAVTDDYRLLAVSATQKIDDENKAGRGNKVLICPLENQLYFKMMVTHPSQRGQGLALPMYTQRVIDALKDDNVQYCVMKSNNPDVHSAYSGEYGFGWEQHGDDYILSDDELGGHADTPEHLRINKTFVIKTAALANWLEMTNPQAFEKLLKHGTKTYAGKNNHWMAKYA